MDTGSRRRLGCVARVEHREVGDLLLLAATPRLRGRADGGVSARLRLWATGVAPRGSRLT
jgi:hypothetical protein